MKETMPHTPTQALSCPNCGAGIPKESASCPFCRSQLSVTACPVCFGPLFRGMSYCPACGTAAQRNEVQEDKALTCPRCESPLATADLHGTRIRECGQCGGIWLDAATFQKICADRDQPDMTSIDPAAVRPFERSAEVRPKKFYIPCPQCKALMNQKNFSGCSGVIIDTCKSHGIWLDWQELQKIVLFIRAGGLQKARARELEHLKEEEKRLEAMKRESMLAMSMPESPSAPGGLQGEALLAEAVFTLAGKLMRYWHSRG